MTTNTTSPTTEELEQVKAALEFVDENRRAAPSHAPSA
jgi:hypothetical protein